MQLIKKRDGTETLYDSEKVFQAILSAFSNVQEIDRDTLDDISDLTDSVTDKIEEFCEEVISVNKIQDLVIDTLLESEFNDVSKEYIQFSTKRQKEREDSVSVEYAINKLFAKDPSVINENGNKDSRKLSTQRDMTAGQVARSKGLQMLPEKVRNAHIKGEVYWHDIDFSPLMAYPNCCNVNLEGMLRDGFSLGEAFIQQPKGLTVASRLIIDILGAVANSSYGGTTFPDIDKVLGVYAEKDYNRFLEEALSLTDNQEKAEEFAKKKFEQHVYQCMQSLEYGINSMHANANATPFVTLTFGTGTNMFEREIQKAYLNVRIEGLGEEGHKKTAVFPKLCYFVKKGINFFEHDVNYDIKKLAIECMSKRVYPDILNVDKLVEITGMRTSPMGW